jgi:hypothetical protein
MPGKAFEEYRFASAIHAPKSPPAGGCCWFQAAR